MNVNSYTHLYRNTIHGAGLTGSAVYLYMPTVEPGRVRFFSHVSAEDKTTDFTKIRFGIRNTGILYYLDELQNISANELVSSVADFILGEGDRLFAEFTGTTTGDVLLLSAWGWEDKL